MELKFPDGREPTDPHIEVGFDPQPPASVRPDEPFGETISFWCYPYASLYDTCTPRVLRETDLDRAPLIPDPGEKLVFNFDWIDLSNSMAKPFPSLRFSHSLNETDVRRAIENDGYIKFPITTLNKVPRCGDYRICVLITLLCLSRGTVKTLKGGVSNIVSVR